MSERNVPEVTTSGEFKRIIVNGKRFLLMRTEDSSFWVAYRIEISRAATGWDVENILTDLGTFFDYSDAVTACIAFTNKQGL